MKVLYFLLSFSVFIIFSCKKKPKEIAKDYELILEDGIYFEKFDSIHVDQNRFTKNNITFREGVVFTYRFKHLTRDNQQLLFTWDESITDSRFAWKFVKKDSIDKNTINKVVITVKQGLEPMIQYIPDYNQTIIQYEYLTQDGKAPFNSASGVVENEKNIWMHPPRDKYFCILELNPFPFIKEPYKVGNEWQWSLEIGNGWGDERWKTWDGQIVNNYTYKIVDKKIIESSLGKIECFVIDSEAISRIGETKLVSYFSPEFGFVKLDYTNIDGSKTLLELSDYSKED